LVMDNESRADTAISNKLQGLTIEGCPAG